MNFKRLLLFLAAPLALVMSSCEPDGPVYTNPSISITDADGAEVTAVNFGVEGGDATITITATRGWSISKQATWLGVTPSTYTNDTMEEKSVDVKITVGPNEGGPRTETIKVVMDKIEKNITVAQADNEGNTLGPKGAGTLEEPYNVARAMEIILADTYTEDMVYTSGIISQLGEDGREQYGNYTFYISDDGTTAGQLLAFRCKYLNGKNFTISDNLEVGDEVIICGQLVNFKGNTPEIQSCYIVSHNGEMPDAPALKEGVYASDAAFVCNIDNSSKCVYSLGDTNVGGNDVSGFKLGTGSKSGVFTSQAIGVSGDKYLNFYAVAWNGKSSTLYWRVNGGEPMSQTLVANAGANNNAPYNGLVIAATDHYSVQLTGLQATDVIEFSTNAAFKAVDDATSGRAIVFGIKLTDEPLEGESGSGNTGGGDQGGDQGGETPAPENALLWASFATDMANFTTENVELGGLDYVWYHDAQHKQMKASAYKDNVRYVTESYLVSPVVALTGAEDYYMNFEHTGKFFGNMSEQATLWVREEGGAWAQLTIPTYMTGNDWTFVNSGDIALTAYAGKNIQIGFRYTSTATDAPTWEVTNVLVAKGTAGETPEQPEEPEQPEVEIPEGAIVWEFGKDKQEWADDTHATYGAGTAATVDNVKFGFYKNTNTNDWNTTLQNDHVRVFKGAALAVKATDGKLIKSVVFECTYADKCANLSVSDGSTAVADTEALTISWTNEEGVAEFAAVAAANQVRLKKMYLVLEGEGGGNTEPEDPEQPEDPETPEDPEQPTTVTLDEIAEYGTYNITGATVVAVEYNNMVVKGTEKMLNVKKLANASANYNVGDVLSLTNATVKDAYGVTVIDGEAADLVIEKTGTATVEHGEATAIDAAWVTSFTESLVPEYVTVSGVGAASGSQYSLNIAVEGSDINMSVTLPTKDEVTALVGKNVTATGYAFDYNSKNKYVSIMKVELTVVEGGETPEEPEQPEEPETPAELAGTGEGTLESPYDVVRAKAAIDAYTTVSGVYVKGVVTTSEIVFSSKYSSCDYYISVDGTTDNELMVYSGKFVDGASFTSADQIHAGDEVVVYGDLKIYNGTYEFNYSSKIVSLTCNHETTEPEQPETPVDPASVATISFADVANRTVFTGEQQVWEQNGITVTNDKASSTNAVADYSNPARFYAGSNITIESESNMSEIHFDCAGGKNLKLDSCEDYTVSGSGTTDVTVTLTTPATSFTITALSAQVRLNSLTVTFAE